MFTAKQLTIATTLALVFALSAGAEAQTAPNRTNVTADVNINQNIGQPSQFGNVACRQNPRSAGCGPTPDQRTASGAQRQGSSATQGGGPRPKRR